MSITLIKYPFLQEEDLSGCVVYNTANGVCKDVLQELQTCLPDGHDQSSSNTSEIYVSAGEDIQEKYESIVLIGKSLADSPECEEVVVPFLCQYFFSPCDGSGESYLPSSEECRVVSTEICPSEWELANNLLGIFLPSCDTLPEMSLSCNGKW